jgi:hypothetical protein
LAGFYPRSFHFERELEIVLPLLTHIRLNPSGNFNLTGACRPDPNKPTELREGYRLERFRDPVSRARIPMLASAVSAEHLFDVFLDLLTPIGESAHVVLETSHDSIGDYHEDLRRGGIDLPVLCSHFCDHEDLLLNDGCTGVAVVAPGRPVEVQFDEHKLLYVYAHDLKPFRKILRRHDDLKLVAESEHLHHTTLEHAEEFRQLCYQIGAGDFESVLSDESGWLQ